MVKFNDGVTQQEINKVLALTQTTILKKTGPSTYMLKLGGLDLDRFPQTIVQLQNQKTKYAEPDYVVVRGSVPNDPSFYQLWGMHNTGQTGGVADADIDAPEAWDVINDASEVLVGVIDTGADLNHPDLAANIYTNTAEIPGNGIDDDQNGFVDDVHGWNFYNDNNNPQDDHYHGTHVAGTIGALGNNGGGVAGVCWKVKMLPIKFLGASGSGYTSDAIDCINYATKMKVRLTSNSWGGGSFSQGLKDAIDAANNAGILFVAAAGNNGANTDTTPNYPSL